jgi:LacI family transcriptional regulator/LacI family purine nucleotide synthesis repressor
MSAHSKKGAPRKKVTMADIAGQLGVSKNSVSLALSDRHGVSDGLRKRVMEKASEMRYGDYAGRGDCPSACIALLVPEYLHEDAFFYSDVFWAIEAEAKRRGYISINIGISGEMEAALALPVLPDEMRFIGLLAVGVMRRAYVEKLYSLGLPLISVDIEYSDLLIGCVGSANLSGGYMAARYLLDCGHREVGFIGPINTALSIYERFCGFQLAMRRAGLADSAVYNITGDSAEFQLFDTVEVLGPLYDRIHSFPTAWFCAGDRIAIALCGLLAQRGVRVPDEISVMGFDGLSVSEIVTPKLTTINIDRRQMGKRAVEALHNMAARNERSPVNISVLGTLAERDSVRKISLRR